MSCFWLGSLFARVFICVFCVSSSLTPRHEHEMVSPPKKSDLFLYGTLKLHNTDWSVASFTWISDFPTHRQLNLIACCYPCFIYTNNKRELKINTFLFLSLLLYIIRFDLFVLFRGFFSSWVFYFINLFSFRYLLLLLFVVFIFYLFFFVSWILIARHVQERPWSPKNEFTRVRTRRTTWETTWTKIGAASHDDRIVPRGARKRAMQNYMWKTRERKARKK